MGFVSQKNASIKQYQKNKSPKNLKKLWETSNVFTQLFAY